MAEGSLQLVQALKDGEAVYKLNLVLHGSLFTLGSLKSKTNLITEYVIKLYYTILPLHWFCPSLKV